MEATAKTYGIMMGLCSVRIMKYMLEALIHCLCSPDWIGAKLYRINLVGVVVVVQYTGIDPIYRLVAAPGLL